MKKILKSLSLVFLLLLTFVPKNIQAAGSISINKSSMTIYKGDTGTFTITAKACSGTISVVCDNTSVATVSSSFKDWNSGTKIAFMDENSASFTVKGVNYGTCTITIKCEDVTSTDLKAVSGTYKITIKVTDAPSSNNEFASFDVENFEVVEVEPKNYTLSVGKLVDSINIVAGAKDPDASISGAGVQQLNEGENIFDVTCIAANGAKNTYRLTVTRLDSYFLSDLESLLESDINDINIFLTESDGALTVGQINSIKSKSKNVTFKSENGYSVLLDNKKLTNTGVYRLNYNVNYKDAALDLASNYAKGININLNGNKLAEGLTLRIDTTKHFDDGALVDVYSWNPATGKLDLLFNEVEVLDGKLDLSDLQATHLFITASNINNSSLSFNTLTLVFAGVALIELIIIIVVVTPKKKKYEK